MIEEMFGGPAAGRHALDEDAVQTPIFHALKRGGWRQRQQEHTAASVEEFRRDPLTAPIPIQALAPAPARERPWEKAAREAARDRLPRGGSRDGSREMLERGSARERPAPDWSREWSPSMPPHEQPRERSTRDGTWERSARDWAQERSARDGTWERSAHEWAWERSAALAGQGRHHREPAPALW